MKGMWLCALSSEMSGFYFNERAIYHNENNNNKSGINETTLNCSQNKTIHDDAHINMEYNFKRTWYDARNIRIMWIKVGDNILAYICMVGVWSQTLVGNGGDELIDRDVVMSLESTGVTLYFLKASMLMLDINCLLYRCSLWDLISHWISSFIMESGWLINGYIWIWYI